MGSNTPWPVCRGSRRGGGGVMEAARQAASVPGTGKRRQTLGCRVTTGLEGTAPARAGAWRQRHSAEARLGVAPGVAWAVGQVPGLGEGGVVGAVVLRLQQWYRIITQRVGTATAAGQVGEKGRDRTLQRRPAWQLPPSLHPFPLVGHPTPPSPKTIVGPHPHQPPPSTPPVCHAPAACRQRQPRRRLGSCARGGRCGGGRPTTAAPACRTCPP
jgi:hypothetical protein